MRATIWGIQQTSERLIGFGLGLNVRSISNISLQKEVKNSMQNILLRTGRLIWLISEHRIERRAQHETRDLAEMYVLAPLSAKV